MMFICYSLALALLGAAYHWPDLFLLAVLALASRFALR